MGKGETGGEPVLSDGKREKGVFSMLRSGGQGLGDKLTRAPTCHRASEAGCG